MNKGGGGSSFHVVWRTQVFWFCLKEDADLDRSSFPVLNNKTIQLEMLYLFNDCGKVITRSDSKSAISGELPDFRTV